MPSEPRSIKRVGNALVLPKICAVRGTVDGPLFRRDEKLLFFPYWSILLIPLGLVPFLLAFAVLRREQKVTYYLSEAGQTTVRKRRLSIGGLMLVAVATMFVGAMGALWVFWLTIAALAVAACLYRKLFFPFKFGVADGDAVIVYSLPKSFDEEVA